MPVGWHWRLVRWRPSTTVRISLVHDALEQALWTRRRDGSGSLAGSIHHTGAESHCTLIALTGRLAAAGISASVGTQAQDRRQDCLRHHGRGPAVAGQRRPSRPDGNRIIS